jgi:hypothetical protein
MRTAALLALHLLPVCAGVAALAVVPADRPAPPVRPVVASVARTTTAVQGRPVTVSLRTHPTRATAPHRPARVHHRTRRPVQVVARTHVRPAPATTPRQRLDAALARVPGAGAGITWVLTANDGHWGTTDWYRNVVYVSPLVPADRLFDVVVHEWGHVVSVRAYGGDVDLAVRQMTRYFGGAGLLGAERAADCIARLSGAGWTHYTNCTNAGWRAGARRLLAGQRL